MQMVLFLTTGLITWLVLYSIGQKPMDAFIVGALIVLVGATIHILKRYIPQRSNSRL